MQKRFLILLTWQCNGRECQRKVCLRITLQVPPGSLFIGQVGFSEPFLQKFFLPQNYPVVDVKTKQARHNHEPGWHQEHCSKADQMKANVQWISAVPVDTFCF